MMVRILIENENERVYVEEYGTPTIRLGDGGTAISDVICEDGSCGICFSEAIENNGVGADQTDKTSGMDVVDLGAYLQILTDNPASLDVLIDKCNRAKESLSANK